MLFTGSLVRLSAARRCFISTSCRPILATFDFDKTIIDQDSYVSLMPLLTPEQRTFKIQALIDDCSWMVYMERLLELLQSQQNLTALDIGQCVRRLKPVPGMLHLLRRLERSPTVDLSILSDSNSFFIGEWLAAHGLECMFRAGIYTNPALVRSENQHLVIEGFEDQTECDQCPANLCKGGVMQKLIDEGSYERVIYVGDSCNDLCAVRALRSTDIACIRKGEELHKKLPAHRHELCCEVILWRDGHELEQQLVSKNIQF